MRQTVSPSGTAGDLLASACSWHAVLLRTVGASRPASLVHTRQHGGLPPAPGPRAGWQRRVREQSVSRTERRRIPGSQLMTSRPSPDPPQPGHPGRAECRRSAAARAQVPCTACWRPSTASQLQMRPRTRCSHAMESVCRRAGAGGVCRSRRPLRDDIRLYREIGARPSPVEALPPPRRHVMPSRPRASRSLGDLAGLDGEHSRRPPFHSRWLRDGDGVRRVTAR